MTYQALGLCDLLHTVVELMQQTSTKTGLHATVNVITRAYQIGQTLSDELNAQLNIEFDAILPN